jgi:hypothetical protein
MAEGIAARLKPILKGERVEPTSVARPDEIPAPVGQVSMQEEIFGTWSRGARMPGRRGPL